MLSETEIKKIAAKAGVDPGIIERDYVLTKILGSLSQQQVFQDNFVFKGGTAIKKLFFPEWRFLEDLDFTLIQPLRLQVFKVNPAQKRYECIGCLRTKDSCQNDTRGLH